ncbi:MAG: hypothetical protein ACYTEP_06780 [Planctomycetota bacterium]
MFLPPTILLTLPSLCLLQVQGQLESQDPIPKLAHHQEDLPEVGSSEALTAQEDFRAWMDSHDPVPVTPLFLDYQFRFEFQWLSPSEGWEMSVDGTIATEIHSHERIHYVFQGMAVFGDKPPVQFECDLLLDGLEFWISGKAGPSAEMSESFLLKGDQVLLTKLYGQYLDFLPVIAHSPDIQSAGMGQGILAVLDWLPADLETYLHPAGYMRFGTRVMTCRRLTEENGILDADMTLDMSADSVLGMVTSSLESLVSNEDLADPKTVNDLRFLRSLGEKLFAHIRFDAATGTPLGMDLGLEMSFPADRYHNEDSSMRVRFRSDSTRRQPETLGQAQFTIPVSEKDAFDVTPFLQMAQNRMQAFVDEIESSQDAAF